MKRGAPPHRGPSLFEFDFREAPGVPALTPGDLVRQRRGTLGQVQTVFPYWQVLGLHPGASPLRPEWLCRAVPVSEYVGNLWVFPTDALEPLGAQVPVPSHNDVYRWMQGEWGASPYTVKLNFQPDGTVYFFTALWEAAGCPGQVVRSNPHGGVYVKLPLLRAERELLDVMRGLPWQCGRFTRDFYPEVLPPLPHHLGVTG